MYYLIVSTYEVLVVPVFLDRNHLVGLIVRTSRLRHHVKFAFGSVTIYEDSIASVALIDIDAPCPTHYAHGRFGLAQVLQAESKHVGIEQHQHKHHSYHHSQCVRIPCVADEQHLCPSEADKKVDKTLEGEQTAKVEVDVCVAVNVDVKPPKKMEMTN